jgi:hypothetical protein
MNRWVLVRNDWDGAVAGAGGVGIENCACGGGRGAMLCVVYSMKYIELLPTMYNLQSPIESGRHSFIQ